MLASVSTAGGHRDAARQPGGSLSSRRLAAERGREREASARPGPRQHVSEIQLLRALEERGAGISAIADFGGSQGFEEGKAERPSAAIQAEDAVNGRGNRYHWESGMNLGKELLRRRECGREATAMALNFRDSDRRAQSRLYVQHKFSNPSRFFKEAARHPEGDIIDSMALGFRTKVALLGCETAT
eukprot:evm.model.scf_740.2 EVM.evm.TU.scf_740.2   scf_740:37347-39341(-)